MPYLAWHTDANMITEFMNLFFNFSWTRCPWLMTVIMTQARFTVGCLKRMHRLPRWRELPPAQWHTSACIVGEILRVRRWCLCWHATLKLKFIQRLTSFLFLIYEPTHRLHLATIYRGNKMHFFKFGDESNSDFQIITIYVYVVAKGS